MRKILSAIFIIILLIGVYLWSASFIFRFLESNFSIQSFFKGKFELANDIRSYPFDILFYTAQYFERFSESIQKAYLLAFIPVFLLILLGIISIIQRNNRKLYGDAQWATLSDLKSSGMILPSNKTEGLFAGTNLIIGKYKKSFLAIPGQLFGFLAAPTRSGKGVGVVLPICLSYSDSLVVLDIKKEAWQITSAYRKKHGHEVFLFDPFDANFKTARWNSFTYVRREAHLRVNDITQIGHCLYDSNKTRGDKFFLDAARNLFVGLALYLFDKEAMFDDYTPIIKDVLNLASDNTDENSVDYIKSLAKDEFVSDDTRRLLTSVSSSGENTFASILGTLTTGLQAWNSETVASATSGDDFNLKDVRKKKITIYLGILPGDLDKSETILNLFFSQLINENTKVLPEEDRSLKHQCTLLMDEASAPGNISILPKSLSYMAGYNMRLMMILQSPAQLRQIYGENNTDNMITNMGARVLFTAKSVKDSEEYSRLLGKQTIRMNTQTNKQKLSTKSSTVTLNSRDLMLPQEFREMPQDEMIIVFERSKYPIKANKIRYYEDRVFRPKKQTKGASIKFHTQNLPPQKTKINMKNPFDDIFLSEFAKEISNYLVEG